MSSESVHPDVPRRKAVKVAAAALVNEVGFTHAEDETLETLTEMIQSFLFECGRSSRGLAELSGRTEPMLSDVVLALVEMGTDVQALPAYSKRPNKMVFMPPGPGLPTPTPRTLQAGKKKTHPSYIPDFYPQFPDPHTYIKTATHQKPITEYQMIREKAATQKRDVERALTRFIAKTGETENLFPDDPYAFPLIACQSKEIPYLEVLIPKDFDLDAEEPHTDQQPTPQNEPPGEKEDPNKSVDSTKGSAANTSANTAEPVPPNPANTSADAQASNKLAGADATEVTDEGQIDNPYLRPIKMPKLKTGKSKSKY